MADLQHVVDAVTGIRGPDSSLLDLGWRVELVDRHLAQWQLFIFGFPWGMLAGIPRELSAGGWESGQLLVSKKSLV